MFVHYDAEGVAEVMGLTIEQGAMATQPGFQETGGRSPSGFTSSQWENLDGDVTTVQATAPMSSIFIEKAVEQGLPRKVLRRLAERIAGADRAKISALEWSVVPKTTLERRESRLSPQESERTERVARLFVHARRALGSEDEARSFVMTAHPELDGRSPVEAAKTDLGTRRAEQILNALEYGLAL